VGISIENQKQLFTNVVQFNARAQHGGGGSGLGLWIRYDYPIVSSYNDAYNV
jgi:hypothetical protein